MVGRFSGLGDSGPCLGWRMRGVSLTVNILIYRIVKE